MERVGMGRIGSSVDTFPGITLTRARGKNRTSPGKRFFITALKALRGLFRGEVFEEMTITQVAVPRDEPLKSSGPVTHDYILIY